jgi:radical SAM-linked protein
MEGVFSRGDRRLGKVILNAWRKGCRMDGWSSEFRAHLWEEALAEANLDAAEFLRERGADEPLPWDLVDTGVSREYLLAELARAAESVPTSDCRVGKCTGCGLCDFQTVKPRSAERPLEYPEQRELPPEPETEPEGERVRFVFTKTGPAALLSHLETTRLLLRAFRSAKIAVSYSHGFNPHPKLQLGPALSLGVESLCETGEMRVDERPNLAEAVLNANAHLPEGLRVTAMWQMARESRTLTGGGMEEEFLLTLSEKAASRFAELGGIEARIESYRESGGLTIIKRRKGKPDRALEASEFVMGLWPADGMVGLRVLRKSDGATLSPEAFVSALLGLSDDERALDRVRKTNTTIY